MKDHILTTAALALALSLTATEVAQAEPTTAAPTTAADNWASCTPAPGSQGANTAPKNAAGVPTSSLYSGADVLSKFSTTATNGATLASAQIVRGYINAWMKADGNNCGVMNALSIEVSATAQVSTSSFADYAREEMLGARSGIVNIYFNPFAGRDQNNGFYKWNDRAVNSDHIYMAGPFKTLDRAWRQDEQTDPKDSSYDFADQQLGFYLFGIGGRGVKTASSGSTTAAVGTAYVGFGVDGPFHDAAAASSTASGGLSAEFYLTGNYANRNTLKTMFNTTDATSFYPTFGGSLTFWVTGKLFLSLEYDKGFGAFGERVLRDATLFRFGYGNPTSGAGLNTKPPSGT